jgi:hypothetical protein
LSGQNNEQNVKPKWVRERAAVFTDNIDMTKVESICILDTLENIDPINISVDTINSIIVDYNDVMKNAAKQARMIVMMSNSSHKKNVNNNKHLASRKAFSMMNVMSNVKHIGCLAGIITEFVQRQIIRTLLIKVKIIKKNFTKEV